MPAEQTVGTTGHVIHTEEAIRTITGMVGTRQLLGVTLLEKTGATVSAIQATIVVDTA